MAAGESDLSGLSRRDFLALSAGVFTALSLGDADGICHAADIRYPEGRCRGKTGTRVLVTYASKYGSTGGVADAIGKEFCSRGVDADVALVKNVRDISSYQGVVVGSAIYMGKWMSEAMDFLKENREALSQMPVACFLVCLTLSRPTEKSRAEALSYMDPVLQALPEIKPAAVGTFAGALDYNNLSWPMRMIMKSREAPEGDFRDWNAIRTWAREPVYAQLVREKPGK